MMENTTLSDRCSAMRRSRTGRSIGNRLLMRKIKGVIRAEIAGSLRRRRETVADVDLIASVKDMSEGQRIAQAFLEEAPRRLDEDLAEEMRDHMERRAADLQRGGMSGAEAQRQAARSFGNLTGIRETSRRW